MLDLKKINIPKYLENITTFDPADEVSPYEVGLKPEDIDAIWKSVENLYRSAVFPAITICIRRKGKIILNRAIGHAEGNGPNDNADTPKVLVTPDTPICLFSASKSITAMMIHLLAERGQISLMDPVSYYIPKFGVKGKRHTTIYHILSHRGGIPSMPGEIDPEMVFNYDQCVDMLCDAKPSSRGGHRLAYHAVTGGFILGEIIRVVTGKTIREYLKENVQEPLGFNYFSFGLPKEYHDHAALNYYTGYPVAFPLSFFATRALGATWDKVIEISNDPRFFNAIIPAGNIYATAKEVCTFFQLLLNQGEIDGKRIFHPLTVQHAIMETGRAEFDLTFMLPMRYSAGMVLGSDPIGLYGPYTQHAFGHLGFINILCWADPDRDISVALLNTGKPLLGPNLTSLVQLLCVISCRCPKKRK
ncbi:MAG: beta-lactamase family protein [Desulfobacterales bacterium]|nr:beta-lactamase family protein [Desulfobacterales bacterium]